MLAEKRYAYDLNLPEKKSVKKQKEFKLLKTEAKIVSTKSKATLLLTTLFIFSMLLLITYRYNLISEKNLKVQKLKNNLEVAKSELAVTQIEVDKLVDVGYVESYAKQQLGMQKPEKSQMVYINMDSEESVEKITKSNIFTETYDKIKGAVNNLFNK